MQCKGKVLSLLVLAGLLLLVFAPQAAAADRTAAGFLTGIENQFMAEAREWANPIMKYAQRLFYLLALITLLWQFIPLFINGFKGDIGDAFAPLLRWVISTGFFYWLLEHSSDHAVAILSTFRKMGGELSSQGDLNPSAIIDIALYIVGVSGDAMAKAGFTDRLAAIPMHFAAIGTAAILALIAAQVLVILCGAWIMAYAGIIVVGFGGSSFTREMAISYYKHMLGIGLHIMTLYLIVGIGVSQITTMAKALKQGGNAAPSLSDAIMVLMSSLILYVLTSRVPPMVAGLASGGTGGLSGGVDRMLSGAIAGTAGAAGAVMVGAVTNTISAGSLVSQLRRAVGAGGGGSGSAPSAEQRPGDVGASAVTSGVEQAGSVLPAAATSGGVSPVSGSYASAGALSRAWAGARSATAAIGTRIVENANRRSLLGQAANALKDSTVTKAKEAVAAELKKQLGEAAGGSGQSSAQEGDAPAEGSEGSISGGK